MQVSHHRWTGMAARAAGVAVMRIAGRGAGVAMMTAMALDSSAAAKGNNHSRWPPAVARANCLA